MLGAQPSQPLSQLSEDSQQKLKYIRVCTIGIWVCALGRWADGNPFGAANDIFSSTFGACLFEDDLLHLVGLESGAACPAGGFSCLFPFSMLAGINSCFDLFSLFILCMPCFRSTMEAQSTLCSGCFFTLGAALFQASGSVLSWQVYHSSSLVYGYGDIQTMQKNVDCAVDMEEGSAHLAVRTGMCGSARETVLQVRDEWTLSERPLLSAAHLRLEIA